MLIFKLGVQYPLKSGVICMFIFMALYNIL